MEPAAGVEGRGGEIKERAWGGEGGEKADKLERAEGGRASFLFFFFARGMT